MFIENENTFRKALETGINLFLGSGFSVLANDETGKPLPIGDGLIKELSERFSLPFSANITLSQICTIIEASQKNRFYRFLKERFSVGSFDGRYYYLDSLNIKALFTTNIDSLLFKIFATSKFHYINDITHRGPSLSDRTAIDFIPLHGSIIYDDHLTFSAIEIANSFRSDPDKWHYLTGRLQKYPTLFWGYSLSDAGALQAINPDTIKGREHQDKWIVLLRDDDQAIQYFKAMDFQIIISDTSELLEYIKNLNIKIKTISSGPSVSTHDLFPEEAIPLPGTVPVRPLMYFYIGSGPTWYDIYSGQIHKTAHFSSIIDSINASWDTIIVGLPGCGKTTLMMQVAASVNYPGHKLVCESLSLEKAQLILEKLENENALIFIDNFADDIEAFDKIFRATNVVIVGFDREYNFDIVSHKIDMGKCKVINVTELNNKDIQVIFSKIPSDVRSKYFVKPHTEEGINPSIFELMESNILKPSLKTRFHSVLGQLYRENVNLHDLLVMCCYVHSCRTPVSFDMAFAFMRDSIEHYSELYNMVDHLGSMILEYSGIFIDSPQDHFMPRSIIVSEAVIDQVSSNALRRVLVKFHNEVSPYRICRFDIFRRKAYDKEFIGKAFPKWEEGKEFYEKVYERDQSPYLLQQGALYLAHRKQFREAFSWIDKAILQTRSQVFSIRNSHAIILFRANIDSIQTDITVRQTLKQSMEILSECYASDKRKTYHAEVFAEQALQYYEVYGDSVAHQYLEKANQWLIEERKHASWNRNVKRLLRNVSNKLRQIK